jgi:hypothetical protein
MVMAGEKLTIAKAFKKYSRGFDGLAERAPLASAIKKIRPP